MQQDHYALWARCRAFVAEACRGRDATHGLPHMERVTQQAVLLCLMNHTPSSSFARLRSALQRVVLIGMLHDVNDHKYDKDGTLESRVKEFVNETLREFPLSSSEDKDDIAAANDLSTVMLCLSAISYSKEKSRGMRWFETELPSKLWVGVRDTVSDADKLEAIGLAGLHRCYEYTIHAMKGRGEWEAAIEKYGADRIGIDFLLPEVLKHADEKLLRLRDQYIVTPAGKFLADPLHAEMEVGLAEWAARGPPPLPASE